MDKLTPTFVQSTNIQCVAHQGGDLFVRFNYGGGTCYRYTGVPAETYSELLTAESVGRFFDQRVKKSFPYERLTQDPFMTP